MYPQMLQHAALISEDTLVCTFLPFADAMRAIPVDLRTFNGVNYSKTLLIQSTHSSFPCQTHELYTWAETVFDSAVYLQRIKLHHNHDDNKVSHIEASITQQRQCI